MGLRAGGAQTISPADQPGGRVQVSSVGAPESPELRQ